MKIRPVSIFILCICIFLNYGTPVLAEETAADQIILSWTSDPAHSQTISWKGEAGKEGYVQYNEAGRRLSAGKQVKATKTAVRGGKYYRCKAEITGLNQKTKYDFRVGDGKHWGTLKSFTTAPMAQGSEQTVSDEESGFSFLYLGDVQYEKSRDDFNVWGRLLKDAYRRNPDVKFGLIGGDMVNSPKNLKEWNLFLSNAAGVFSKIPLMTTPGNHETYARPLHYLKMMAVPDGGIEELGKEFYSFDYRNCHILMLNSCFFMRERKALLGEEAWRVQLSEINDWIDRDLAASDARWKLVVMHHPVYGLYDDSDHISAAVQKEWEPRLEYGKVDLVFCGHQHIYMRTEEIGGVTYVMGNSGQKRSTYYDGVNFPDYGKALDAANSNYQIIKVGRTQLSMTSYDEKGQIIDRWTKNAGYFTRGKIIGIGVILAILLAAAIFGRIFWLRKGIAPKRPC